MPRVHLPDGRVVHFPDTMSEADIGRAVEGLLTDQGAAPQAPTAQPSLVDRALADNPLLPPQARVGMALARFVKANPVTAGAIGGGLVAAPLTGGASLVPAMAASGLGAAGGAGLAIAGRQLATGRPESATDTLTEMAKQGALGATGEGVGRVASGALRLAGRGLYRAGLLPINQVLGKYGDVVREGVEHAVPVTKKGLEKAKGVKAGRVGAKRAAIAAADDRVAFRAAGIADDAKAQMAERAKALADAGEPDPSAAMQATLDRFSARHPQGVSPSALETIKSTLDDRLGGAYQKLRQRQPLTPREEGRMALSQAASRAQETVVPGYREMNKRIMDATGLERALGRRVEGSAANQGLENALAMVMGPAALPARLAMLPPVLSNAGIAAYQVGKRAQPAATALVRSLLAALGASEQ